MSGIRSSGGLGGQERLPTRLVRAAAGRVVDAACWLTGWSNWQLGRFMLGATAPIAAYEYVREPGYMAAFLFVLLLGLVTLFIFASYRRERLAERALRDGLLVRPWADPLDTLFVWFNVAKFPLGLYVSGVFGLLFWGSFFVFDHHRPGGKSAPARALDAAKAMLSNLALSPQPALVPT